MQYLTEFNFHFADISQVTIDGEKVKGTLFKKGITSLCIRDGYLKKTLTFTFDQPMNVCIHKVDTISQSEGGFDVTNQGSRWDLPFRLRTFALSGSLKLGEKVSQYRYCRLKDNWVIIAEERAQRPALNRTPRPGKKTTPARSSPATNTSHRPKSMRSVRKTPSRIPPAGTCVSCPTNSVRSPSRRTPSPDGTDISNTSADSARTRSSSICPTPSNPPAVSRKEMAESADRHPGALRRSLQRSAHPLCPGL